MLSTILNVVYVLIAIAMIALILMQRGAGAQAGSGFGAGASATVFGSRGAGNFLSKSTKWLAIVFFIISMGMAYMAVNKATAPVATPDQPVAQDLGLMSSVPAAPATGAASASAVPVAPAANNAVPAAPVVQPAPASTAPAAAAPAPATTQTPKTPTQGG